MLITLLIQALSYPVHLLIYLVITDFSFPFILYNAVRNS